MEMRAASGGGVMRGGLQRRDPHRTLVDGGMEQLCHSTDPRRSRVVALEFASLGVYERA